VHPRTIVDLWCFTAVTPRQSANRSPTPNRPSPTSAGVAPRLFRAPGGDWSAAVLSTVADLQMGTGRGRAPGWSLTGCSARSWANYRVVAYGAAHAQGPGPAVRHPVDHGGEALGGRGLSGRPCGTRWRLGRSCSGG
jgi:hypothetical protein